MRKSYVITILATIMIVPSTALAQDARSILETMQQKQLERWDGVDDYLVDQSLMSNATQMYFQRTEVTDSNGDVQTLFLPIASNQRTTGSCTSGAVQMTPEALEVYAQGAEMVGAGMGEEIESGLEEAGLPRGLLAASGSSPTATFDPRVMMGANAQFARGAADAQRWQAEEGARNIASAEQSANHMVQFAQTAKLVGTDTIDGMPAYHLRSDSINQVQQDDGREYRMEAMSVWIDKKRYVPLRMKVDGTMTSGNESKPMVIETHLSDYRSVPNSDMYESYKQMLKISGMMDAAQEAEMREAQVKMQEFEQQMASMPASQRQMMENMMGPQLEMMRQMASGGGFQTETVVRSIQVNPPMVAEDGSPCPAGASKQRSAAPQGTAPDESTADITDKGITRMIQQSLVTLGYDPGNTDGELSNQTVIAISQYQAANGMDVTGQTSPQLAGILSARASGATAPAASSPAARDPEALKVAQQACLQEKIDAARASEKKKRGFGRLLGAVSRVAGQTGNYDLSRTTNDVYTAGATAGDLAAAAKDLGLTEDDVAACQNPG